MRSAGHVQRDPNEAVGKRPSEPGPGLRRVGAAPPPLHPCKRLGFRAHQRSSMVVWDSYVLFYPDLIPRQTADMNPPRLTAANRAGRASAADVMELLGDQYGPVQWEPRYDPASELVYTILSQHTSDVNSGRAFRNLMKTFGTLDAVAQADVQEIEAAIRTAGLFRVKAPRIKAVLGRIMEEVGSFDLSFLGEMPLEEAKSWLRRLDGIGPKTAAIILCFSMGMPAMPVDTHIFRVSRRLGLIGPKVTADQAHDILEPMVDPPDVFAFHIYLIKHGRQVCKAQRPRCDECVLAWECPSRSQFAAPSTKKGGATTKQPSGARS